MSTGSPTGSSCPKEEVGRTEAEPAPPQAVRRTTGIDADLAAQLIQALRKHDLSYYPEFREAVAKADADAVAAKKETGVDDREETPVRHHGVAELLVDVDADTDNEGRKKKRKE